MPLVDWPSECGRSSLLSEHVAKAPIEKGGVGRPAPLFYASPAGAKVGVDSEQHDIAQRIDAKKGGKRGYLANVYDLNVPMSCL